MEYFSKPTLPNDCIFILKVGIQSLQMASIEKKYLLSLSAKIQTDLIKTCLFSCLFSCVLRENL